MLLVIVLCFVGLEFEPEIGHIVAIADVHVPVGLILHIFSHLLDTVEPARASLLN